VEESLMGSLHGFAGGQAGKLGHVADKAHTAHIRDERITLRHVPDLRPQFAKIFLDVFSEDARPAGDGTVEAEQGINERRLAGTIRSQQADASSRKSSGQVIEDRTLTQPNFQILQFDNRGHSTPTYEIQSVQVPFNSLAPEYYPFAYPFADGSISARPIARRYSNPAQRSGWCWPPGWRPFPRRRIPGWAWVRRQSAAKPAVAPAKACASQ